MKPLGLYLRGLLMGFSDLIPGISGGTIALITGVYTALLTNISKCILFAKDIFKGTKVRKRRWKAIDWPFLLSLFAGIVVAIFAGVSIVRWLLDEALVFFLAGLIGLILTSALFLAKKKHVGFLLLGLLFGLGIALLSPVLVADPHWWYLFFAGFVAVCAMLLPGVSGSFILLLFGVYDVVIRGIESLTIATLLPVGAGVVLGGLIATRFITKLLKGAYRPTFSLLVGLVFGSLLVPLQRLQQSYAGESIIGIAACALGGILLVVLLWRMREELL